VSKVHLEVTMMKRIGELNAEVANLKSTADQSKAEVERLEAVIESHKDAGLRVFAILDEERRLTKHLKEQVERLTAFTTHTIIPNELLQAEVERLTKAGDAMASSIQFNEEMAQDYNGPTIVHQSVQRWRAAKEGETK